MTKYNINFDDLNNDIKKLIFKKRFDLMKDDKYKKCYNKVINELNIIFNEISKYSTDYYLDENLNYDIGNGCLIEDLFLCKLNYDEDFFYNNYGIYKFLIFIILHKLDRL